MYKLEMLINGEWQDVTAFICDPCKQAADSKNQFSQILGHVNCIGKGRCDCQHRSTAEKAESK